MGVIIFPDDDFGISAYSMGSCAMNIIQEHIAKFSNTSRKMLCRAILDEADRVPKRRDGLILAANVRQARLAASSHCQYLWRRESVQIRGVSKFRERSERRRKTAKGSGKFRSSARTSLEGTKDSESYVTATICGFLNEDGLVNKNKDNELWLKFLTVRPVIRQYQDPQECKIIPMAISQRERALYADAWRPAAEIDGIQIKTNPTKGNSSSDGTIRMALKPA